MAKVLENEKERLNALHSYDILDTPDEVEFNNLAKLAAQICDVPFAQINFIDHDRQWTKAFYGVDIKEMPREAGFCHQTIKEKEFLVVENATEDERFDTMEFVTHEPNIRFYAGFNIKGGQGYNLGTICVIGKEPKQLSDTQHHALETLAGEVEARLELRKKNQELERTAAFLESAVDLMLVVHPETLQIERVNEKIEALTGYTEKEVTGRTLRLLSDDENLESNLKSYSVNKDDYTHSFETVFTAKNTAKLYMEVNVTENNDKWLISARDITKRKKVEIELKNEQKLSDTIINILPVNFYMYDENGKAVKWNTYSLNTTGFTSDEKAGLSPLDLIDEEDRQKVKEYISRTLKGEKLGSIEANLLSKSEGKKPHLFNAISFEQNGKNYLVGTGQEITQLKADQKKLEALLDDKEVLLGEVHHRVKNNLAVISGFLQMEEYKTDNTEVRTALSSNFLRVKSMAMIHEDLYKTHNFSKVKFDDYLPELLKTIQQNRSIPDKDIRIKSRIEPVSLNLNQAVPCALIINELISNAYQFAFEGRKKGFIEVELYNDGEYVNLKIRDNGIGLPDNFKLEESPSLGITLIYSLSQQINSKIKINSENGTEYVLRFEKKDYISGSSGNAFSL